MKLLAIDGNSVLNRAFYGIHTLSTKDGIYTNAIYGFLNILLRLQRGYKPAAVAIAFDVSKHTFRNDLFPDYKANRKGMPDELRQQLPLIKEVLTAMGYTLATAEGYEGDDVLGTLADFCDKSGDTCIVASGDRDCLQLLSENVRVCLLKTKEDILYTPALFLEEYGFSQDGVIELKSLMGDASDNIPGVRGVGEKTALGLISTYKNLDTVYENIETLGVTPRIRGLLKEGKEQAYLSRELATICRTAPIDPSPTVYLKSQPNEERLRELLKKLEMLNMFDKLSAPLSLNAADIVEQTLETTIVVPKLLSAEEAQALPKGKRIAILLNEADGTIRYDCDEALGIVSPENSDAFLKAAFESDMKIYTFMAKALYKKARGQGAENIQITFDAELAAYLLNPSAKGYELSTLITRYLDNTIFDVPEEYGDVGGLLSLCDALTVCLEKEGMKNLFDTIEMPLCGVLSDMEDEGFCVDKVGLTQFGEMLLRDIDLVKEQAIRLAGEEFNLNSTKELGRILFEKLALPAQKKTKTGYSTNVDVLESLMDKHEIIPQIMEYRKLTKLYSTYVIGMLKEISTDGRVHSTFNQTETRTGRISSAEPNVQNIPVRTSLGSEMRRFFTARDGYMLVDADYSQIELRILAHIAQDEVMRQGFLENADIHAITASQVFNHPIETLPPSLRSRAKAINFGIVYGISPYSLSQDIHVSVSEAKEYIDAYLKTYSGVANYMKAVVEQARRDSFVTTIYGRKRDLADINSTNKNVASFAARVALNTPVQGTAADIIKLAMIKVHARLKREGLDARLILQVHDELIVEAAEAEAERIANILKEEMENAASLSVPLIADVHIGKDWYTAKG